MKKIVKIMYLLLTLCLFSKVSVGAQTYPEAISYIKVSAFESANQSHRLSDVLIGVFTPDGEQLGVYRTNSEGEVLIEVTPGIIELKVLQSTEGYEVSQQYQVMSIDASNIDLYEVEFPHEPINVVDARKMPTTGLSPIYFMSSFGVSLTCLGVLIVRYLNHEEV